jgi:hypothetical protein
LENEASMRSANAYQALDDTHERLGAETGVPSLRYEALRDTQQELDINPQPEPLRLIDIIEKRRAELDQQLTDLRERVQSPEPERPGWNEQADIDRALALQSGDGRQPDAKAPAPDDYGVTCRFVQNRTLSRAERKHGLKWTVAFALRQGQHELLYS